MFQHTIELYRFSSLFAIPKRTMNEKMISCFIDCFIKESPFDKKLSEEAEKEIKACTNNALMLGFMIGYQLGQSGLFEESERG